MPDEDPTSNRPDSASNRLEYEESRLWRWALLLLILFATAVAALSWQELKDLPYKLWAIPAGPLPPNPADLLQSERFRKFIQELRERFDRIIVDSPPLVAVTDSAILSTLVDGVVFVVRAFQTGKHVSAQGLRALRDVEAPIVGTVLNAVNLNRHEYNYYHYYYYKREGYASVDGAAAGEAVGAPPAPPN